MRPIKLLITICQCIVVCCTVSAGLVGADGALPATVEHKSGQIPLSFSSFSSLDSTSAARRGDIVPSPVYENDHTIFFNPYYGRTPLVWRSRAGDALLSEIQAFVASVRDEAVPGGTCTGRDGREALAVALEIERLMSKQGIQ